MILESITKQASIYVVEETTCSGYWDSLKDEMYDDEDDFFDIYNITNEYSFSHTLGPPCGEPTCYTIKLHLCKE